MIGIKQTLLSILLFAFSFSSFAQGTYNKSELVKGWHLLDKEKDGVYGISLEKAYDFLRSKNLKSKRVLVAVIDSGVDTLQEDLDSYSSGQIREKYQETELMMITTAMSTIYMAGISLVAKMERM